MIPIDVRQKEGSTDASLNLKAICVWAAFGFMLDRDTFFEGIWWDKPDTAPWYYKPASLSFDQAVDKFTATFEEVVKEQVAGKNVILALSGGLDSRTLSAALSRMNVKPFAYSYKFQDSFDETKYGRQISKLNGWQYGEYIIPEGYLWREFKEIAEINQCYSEFTHPRQMAVIKELATHGNIFLLGHWGDVLFDNMHLAPDIPEEELIGIVIKKMQKKGGMDLGADLWKAWGINGDFNTYLKERVSELLAAIKIDNTNARVRAFKSMYWATRWTNTNLQIFSHYHPIAVPYYDDRICKLVCETPEEYLSGRKIQIEYLKRNAPGIARIPWQSKEPYNLFNHHHHQTWRHTPWRVSDKVKRIFREKMLNKKLVTRNWEIQFCGSENDKQLKSHLFDSALKTVIPEEVISKYYTAFKERNPVHYSHPVSMLLTFSAFLDRQKNK